MYPRLVLMRRMLRPDGIIFISCDDNEQATLRLMMNEIFGEDCFVSNIIWQKTYSPKNDRDGIPTATDHIVAYSRKPNWKPFKLERTEGMKREYRGCILKKNFKLIYYYRPRRQEVIISTIWDLRMSPERLVKEFL